MHCYKWSVWPARSSPEPLAVELWILSRSHDGTQGPLPVLTAFRSTLGYAALVRTPFRRVHVLAGPINSERLRRRRVQTNDDALHDQR